MKNSSRRVGYKVVIALCVMFVLCFWASWGLISEVAFRRALESGTPRLVTAALYIPPVRAIPIALELSTSDSAATSYGATYALFKILQESTVAEPDRKLITERMRELNRTSRVVAVIEVTQEILKRDVGSAEKLRP